MILWIWDVLVPLKWDYKHIMVAHNILGIPSHLKNR